MKCVYNNHVKANQTWTSQSTLHRGDWTPYPELTGGCGYKVSPEVPI